MKKLILITDDEYIRNYLDSAAFSAIEDQNTFYLAAERLTHRAALLSKKNFLGFIADVSWRRNLCLDLLYIQMVRHRNRSRTFGFRLRRFRKILQWKYKLLGLPIMEGMATAFIFKKLGVHQQMKKILEWIKPELIIVPSAVTAPLGIDALILAQQKGIKTLFLIDGWDNLSSKSVFPILPDYLAVWGKQSVEHGFKIHGISKDRTFTIGTPRFDHYFTAEPRDLKSPYSFSYVLFAGNSLPFDEISALKIIDQEIEAMGVKDFKVVYRPHPWRQKRSCFDVFKEEDYRHVVIDVPVKEAYQHRQKEGNPEFKSYLPPLEYYPALLNSALFVISPLSTMMVEAAIFNTPVLAICYDDGYHLTSPHNAYKYYEHFAGIENVHGFTLCREKNDLGFCFRKMVEGYTAQKKDPRIKEGIRYFLHFDENTYNQRLKSVCDRIAGQRLEEYSYSHQMSE